MTRAGVGHTLAHVTALLTNALLLVADLAVLGAARRRVWAPLGVLPFVVIGLALVGGGDGFALMQVTAWAVFLHLPIVLVGIGLLTRRRRFHLLALPVVVVGVDAFLVEPRWLEVTHLRLPGPAMRIALVADIQTDRVGWYERALVARINAEEPDLVLFAGDYVQTADADVFVANAKALNEILAGLRAPGIAVEGDVDADAWPRIFAGLPITVVTKSRAIDLGAVVVTALDPIDARSGAPDVAAQSKFHIVVGHPPDYAMARPAADLLLAGHVHGGQVRLPWIGPLITFSSVPRGWATGHTALPWGGDLVVSRGIGMERRNAPRLRFLCRPELVIIDLAPG